MEAEIGVIGLQSSDDRSTIKTYQVIGLQPRNTKDCRQPPDAQKSQEPSEPLEPSERACPCQYLTFGLLASRTPVSSHTLCSTLL